MKKGKDYSPFQGKELTLRDDEIMNTITANPEINQNLSDGINIRRLTPIECERLQGFPDNWTQYNKDGKLVADTQRYKMCGNAVTVNVIREIASKFL